MNTITLEGLTAAPAEIRDLPSGPTVARFLITVRVDEPRRRVDVIPVTMYVTPGSFDESSWAAGAGVKVRVVGSLQRRFWDSDNGTRRSALEVVAREVSVIPASNGETIERHS